MTDQSYTASFLVDQSPREAFEAVNDVRGWWGEDVKGSNAKVGEVFTYRVRDVHYSRLEVVERVPNEKVAWRVLENHMNFVGDQTEWVGTTIVFEIAPKGDRTEVRFTHQGLVPPDECYEVCSDAWRSLMRDSLPALIATGKGHPYR